MNTKAALRLLGVLGLSGALLFACSDDTTAPITDGPSTVDSTVDGKTVTQDTGTADGVTGDTTAGPDATVDTVDCECRPEDGPCCDGCFYYTLTDAHVCESVEEFKCEDAQCGSDALKRVGERLCQGFTADCEGDQTWGDWTTHEACDESSTCVEGADNASASCSVCPFGCENNTCWAECDPYGDCCQADGTNCPHGCDPVTKLCWTECDPASDPCCDADGTGCDRGCDENGDVHAAGTCWPTTCTAATADQCEHGFCADGQCCNTACGGICQACDLAGKQGTCSPYTRGTDPESQCGIYNCNGASACYSSCSCGSNYDTCASSACKDGYYCDAVAGQCVAKKNNGTKCTLRSYHWECSSGFCEGDAYPSREGVCCNTQCIRCRDCRTGSCQNTPANTGPYADPDICNGYSCNGTGSCKTSCPNNQVSHCSTDCNSYYWCWNGDCVLDMEAGNPRGCIAACQCLSNSCFFQCL